jgi:hypothetical protein
VVIGKLARRSPGDHEKIAENTRLSETCQLPGIRGRAQSPIEAIFRRLSPYVFLLERLGRSPLPLDLLVLDLCLGPLELAELSSLSPRRRASGPGVLDNEPIAGGLVPIDDYVAPLGGDLSARGNRGQGLLEVAAVISEVAGGL